MCKITEQLYLAVPQEMTSNVTPTLLGSDMNNHTKKIEKYVSAEVIGAYFQYTEIQVMCYFCH